MDGLVTQLGSSSAFVFLRRLALFSLPLVLVLAMPLYVLARSGELEALDIPSAIRLQRSTRSHILYGPAYSDCQKYYKLEGALAVAPTVMALGNSRVMQLRAPFFTASFYNAGGGASQAPHFRQFLARIPRARQPKLLFISLDHYFFSGVWKSRAEAPYEEQVAGCTNALNVIQRSWLQIYRDRAEGKFRLGALGRHDEYRAIGLNAWVNRNGFRNDGSWLYGQVVRNPENAATHHDFHFSDTLSRIRLGGLRFEWADHASMDLVRQMGEFAAYAERRGIHVVGFLPPYAPTVQDAMARTDHYGYMGEIVHGLEPLFTAAGASFFDFTDTRRLGVGDRSFIDGFHGSDRVYLLMLQEMASRDPKVARYTDHDLLQRLGARSTNPLLVASEQWR